MTDTIIGVFQAAMSLAFLFAWLPSVIVNAYSLKHADKLKDLQWQFDPLVSKGCRKSKYDILIRFVKEQIVLHFFMVSVFIQTVQ